MDTDVMVMASMAMENTGTENMAMDIEDTELEKKRIRND